MSIFINKKIWNTFSLIEMERYKEEVFKHYRKTGFPYYKLSDEQIKHEYDKLSKFNLDSIIKDDIIRQTMHGLALCWNYHPYAFDIVANGARTPLDAFKSDDLLRMAINKRIRYGTFMTDAGMRKTLRSLSGVQAVSNFRPSAAAAIYRKFGGGRVWDPSFGFGGRLIGASASKVVTHYIGTDPSVQAFSGNKKIVAALNLENVMKVALFNEGSENFIPDKKSLDICFTSPPFFNTEKYANEKSQSYKKFPDQKIWMEKFLTKTLENCYFGLKSQGWLIINIANVKVYPKLVDDFLYASKHVGFKLEFMLQYQLSRILGAKHLGKFKYEPIFCFKK